MTSPQRDDVTSLDAASGVKSLPPQQQQDLADDVLANGSVGRHRLQDVMAQPGADREDLSAPAASGGDAADVLSTLLHDYDDQSATPAAAGVDPPAPAADQSPAVVMETRECELTAQQQQTALQSWTAATDDQGTHRTQRRLTGLWFYAPQWCSAGVVIRLERGADLHTAQLMPLPLTVSCFSKIQTDFTFMVLAHPGSLGQRAVKRVCVCVCVCRY